MRLVEPGDAFAKANQRFVAAESQNVPQADAQMSLMRPFGFGERVGTELCGEAVGDRFSAGVHRISSAQNVDSTRLLISPKNHWSDARSLPAVQPSMSRKAEKRFQSRIAFSSVSKRALSNLPLCCCWLKRA